MKTKLVSVSAFMLAFVLASCNQSAPQKTTDGLSDAEIEQRIESVMPQLTLEEKVALVHAQSKFSTPGVPRLGVPELWWSDGPHGVRAEFEWDSWLYAKHTNDSITAFPNLTALAATFNPDLAYEYGVALGEECLYRGKHVILGPTININRVPVNGRNFENFGEDPLLAARMAVPYIKGVQSQGVAASVKHFALNNQETDRFGVDVEVSDRALYEIYLPAFKASILEANSWTVMGAYNKYRGEHCCHNHRLLVDILKGEWNYDGVVVSDWGGTHDTKQAAENGLDVEMGSHTNGLSSGRANAYDDYYLAYPLRDSIKAGKIDEKFLDDKVRRVLRLIYRTHYHNNYGKVGNEEHLALGRKVADEGIVLLQNNDNILPLAADKKMKIAVIGENATRKQCIGGGSSELKARNEISPLQGLQERFPNAEIVYSAGYDAGPSIYGFVMPSRLNADSLKNAAIEAVRDADVVLYFGGLNKNFKQDHEDSDRQTYDLPWGQNELIAELAKVNPNVAVFLFGGNPVAMPWKDSVKSISWIWYLGSETGHAIADVVSGDVCPSGKLPFSIPVRLEDNGAISFGAESYPGVDHKQVYKEDILVGYRWFDTKDIKPLYAFGYGLSYTNFELSNIAANNNGKNITVTASVKNTGAVDGAEVVQVYVGKPNSNIERAKKELRGFQKVAVKRGAAEKVEINIPVENLAFFNAEKHAWEVESGDYTVYVGTASDDIAQELTISVK